MKRFWNGIKYTLFIVGIGILLVLVMDFNNRMNELKRLSQEREIVAIQVKQLEKTKAYLETQIAYATSELAVRAWAYQEGKWVREGDYPVVPLAPPGSTPQPTETPLATPQAESNWRIWLSLFMDVGD